MAQTPIVVELQQRLTDGADPADIIMFCANRLLKGRQKLIFTLARKGLSAPDKIMKALRIDDKTLRHELEQGSKLLESRVTKILPELEGHEFFTRQHPDFDKVVPEVPLPPPVDTPVKEDVLEEETEETPEPDRTPEPASEPAPEPIPAPAPKAPVASEKETPPKEKIKKKSKRKPKRTASSAIYSVRPPSSVKDFRYDPNEEKIYFGGRPLALTPTVMRMMMAIVSNYPKPVSLSLMAYHLFDSDDRSYKQNISGNHYPRLLAQLDKNIPGLSHFMERDYTRGFGFIDDIEPSPDSLPVITWGKWAYSRETGKMKLGDKNFEARPKIDRILKRLVTAFPFTVPDAQLTAITYGLQSAQDFNAAAKLSSLVRSYRQIFAEQNPDTEFPVWYIPSLKSYVLNIGLDAIPDDIKVRIGFVSARNISLSLTQQRLWIGGNPVEKLHTPLFKTAATFVRYAGEYLSIAEVANNVYSEVTPETLHDAKNQVHRFKCVIKKNLPDNSEPPLRGEHGRGYVLEAEDRDPASGLPKHALS